jgi:hypothetical protein
MRVQAIPLVELRGVDSRLDERGGARLRRPEVRDRGVAIVSKITGLARSTFNRGKQDLDAEPLPKVAVVARSPSW